MESKLNFNVVEKTDVTTIDKIINKKTWKKPLLLSGKDFGFFGFNIQGTGPYTSPTS